MPYTAAGARDLSRIKLSHDLAQGELQALARDVMPLFQGSVPTLVRSRSEAVTAKPRAKASATSIASRSEPMT